MKATNINDNWIYDAAEHEKQQLLRESKLTFAQKLRWLEDAHRLALQLQKSKANNESAASTRSDETENLQPRTENL